MVFLPKSLIGNQIRFFRFFPIFRLFPTFRLLDSTTLILKALSHQLIWIFPWCCCFLWGSPLPLPNWPIHLDSDQNWGSFPSHGAQSNNLCKVHWRRAWWLRPQILFSFFCRGSIPDFGLHFSKPGPVPKYNGTESRAKSWKLKEFEIKWISLRVNHFRRCPLITPFPYLFASSVKRLLVIFNGRVSVIRALA